MADEVIDLKKEYGDVRDLPPRTYKEGFFYRNSSSGSGTGGSSGGGGTSGGQVNLDSSVSEWIKGIYDKLQEGVCNCNQSSQPPKDEMDDGFVIEDWTCVDEGEHKVNDKEFEDLVCDSEQTHSEETEKNK